jgi:hypothetical protein
MWWLLAAFIVLMVLLPKPKIENARASNLGDFQFPRAKEGDPVPLIWGTVRLKSPNTIWYGDFKAVPITEKVKTGLFSSKTVITGYKYYLGLDLALCLGGGVKLTKIWAGKYVAWTGSQAVDGNVTITEPELYGGEKQRGGLVGTAAFYSGGFSQAQDAYLVTNCDANTPRYGGISHIVFKAFYFGTQAQLEPFHFELGRFSDVVSPGHGVMANGLDLNPMEILYDALTSKWGRLGIDVAGIDTASWAAAANTLYTEDNGMSLKLEQPNDGKAVAEEVLRQADGILYQDPETSKIKAKLIRFDYDPNTLPVLTQAIVKDISNFSKSTWDATFNQCRVTFPNRDKDYADSVAAAQDFANINFQARVKSTEVSFPACTRADLASELASRVLAIYSVPLYKCTLKCTRAASFLRPGDVFCLTWEPFFIVKMVMRVQRIDLGDLTNGVVTITCLQDKFAVNNTIFAPPETGTWTAPNDAAAPVTVRYVFESPMFLMKAAGMTPADDQGTLYSVGKAPTAHSLSYDFETSLDTFATTTLAIDAAIYCASARLVTTYASTAGGTLQYDTTTGVRIDGLTNIAILQTASRSTGSDGRSLFVIEGEIMSYTAFVDNLDGSYTLQNISRGFLDTLPSAHTSGVQVFFIVGQEGLSDALLPDTATVKARMRDNTASSTLAASSALVDTLTLDRRAFRPAAPAYLTLAGSRTPATQVSATTVTADWRERSRLASTLVYYDDTTQTPEAGTTYTLRYKLGAGAWTTVTGIATNTYAVPVTGLVGTLTVEVWAVRSSLASRITDTLTIVLT